MAAQLQKFFTAQANQLADCRLSSMVRAYQVPLMVFLVKTQRWHLLQSRHDVLEAFFAKHRGVAAAGVGKLRARVTRESFTGTDRCRADVTWFYVGRHGRRLGRTHARYFLTRRADGFNIDMIEFRHVAFPQINDWFSRNARELPVGIGPRLD